VVVISYLFQGNECLMPDNRFDFFRRKHMLLGPAEMTDQVPAPIVRRILAVLRPGRCRRA
jgi:hypothetical protein